MTYSNDFVAVVKCGGKILKERRENGVPIVYLPFGSEYSLYFKNLSTKRAKVNVEIDGVDVLSGKSLIVNGNSTLNLERFLDRLDKGNRFKFIEKTQQISDHRGDKIDDGIIRITYQFESNQFISNTVYVKSNSVPILEDFWFAKPNYTTFTCNVNNVSGDVGSRGVAGTDGLLNSCYSSQVSAPVNDDGITVKGSQSNQKFEEGRLGLMEWETRVITFQLRGGTGPVQVTQPIFVKQKTRCGTCGTVHKGFPNFCNNCGTAMDAEIR